MSLELHRIERTNAPARTTTTIAGEQTDIKGSLTNMQACGWFLTKSVIEVIVVSNFCTVVSEDFYLRPDEVEVGCIFKDEHTFECKYCIDKKV